MKSKGMSRRAVVSAPPTAARPNRLKEVLAAGYAQLTVGAPADNAALNANFFDFLSQDGVVLVMEALVEDTAHNPRRLQESCAAVVEFCESRGASGCNELEWRAAAMKLNKKRNEFIDKSISSIRNSRQAQVIKTTRLARFEEMRRRIQDPEVPGTSPTWKEEFKRQCFELVEYHEARKRDEAIAEAKAADELLKQWAADDEESAREKRLRFFHDEWEKRELESLRSSFKKARK